MKQLLVLSATAFLSAAILYKALQPSGLPSETLVKIEARYSKSIGCSPNLSLINFADSTNLIPLLKGWGAYRMPVTYNNDSAHTYFQQGMNMYYSFHILEALASFEKAIRFDPNFGMAYWAKALAYGPNINDLGYSASPEALAAVRKAEELTKNCTPVEKALVKAIRERYSADSTQKREQLNQFYADAMKKVYHSFPQSADAAALYADALMVQHPWDLYDKYYNPKPWTPEIVSILEVVVKKFPSHPGASHYYIHAIEGSKTPEKGLAVANRLGRMMPGVSHLVHMPSHIYIRSGQYEKGVKANLDAVKGYYKNLKEFPLTANNSFLYLVHNLHMQAACASMAGQSSKALQYALETQKSFDTTLMDIDGYFGMYSQYLYLTPHFTLMRFGKWDELLRMPPFPTSQVYATAMLNFAQGIAQARKHQFTKASAALTSMNNNLVNNQLLDHPAAFNPGIAAIEVAQKILEGVIAEEQNNYKEAITALRIAVEKEDAMLYNEPKDWLLPARHYLGQVLLRAKDFNAAEKVYREDLKINPNNIWSLTGLYKTLRSMKKNGEAARVLKELQKAKVGTDAHIPGSVF